MTTDITTTEHTTSAHTTVRWARRRSTIVTGCLALVLALAFCVAVSLGDLHLTLTHTVRAMFGTGDGASNFVVRELRLPRALCAVMVGAALGVSGSIFQTVTRNTLATPDIIGVSGGAAALVAVAMLTFGLSGAIIPLIAMAGACGTAVLMYVLAWRDGMNGLRLVLIGIGVAAFAAAITSYVLTSKPALEAQRALFWLTGSLNDTRWSDAKVAALAVVLVAISAPALRRWMGALELGDETAAALGLRVEPVRLAALAVGTVLTGLSVAVAGPVAFVALLAAPVARRLVRSPGYLHTPAALVGAVVVLMADTVGAHFLGDLQVPVGVLTAVIGAPYLLWVLTRSSRT